MTEITFASTEPNEAFKAAIAARGWRIDAFIPPKKPRKNSRYLPSKYGDIIISMPLDLAVEMSDIARECEQDMNPYAWSSRVILPKTGA